MILFGFELIAVWSVVVGCFVEFGWLVGICTRFAVDLLYLLYGYCGLRLLVGCLLV